MEWRKYEPPKTVKFEKKIKDALKKRGWVKHGFVSNAQRPQDCPKCGKHDTHHWWLNKDGRIVCHNCLIKDIGMAA